MGPIKQGDLSAIDELANQTGAVEGTDYDLIISMFGGFGKMVNMIVQMYQSICVESN